MFRECDADAERCRIDLRRCTKLAVSYKATIDGVSLVLRQYSSHPLEISLTSTRQDSKYDSRSSLPLRIPGTNRQAHARLQRLQRKDPPPDKSWSTENGDGSTERNPPRGPTPSNEEYDGEWETSHHVAGEGG